MKAAQSFCEMSAAMVFTLSFFCIDCRTETCCSCSLTSRLCSSARRVFSLSSASTSTSFTRISAPSLTPKYDKVWSASSSSVGKGSPYNKKSIRVHSIKQEIAVFNTKRNNKNIDPAYNKYNAPQSESAKFADQFLWQML